MKLEGSVRDVGLPEVFRLLKMSGKTGALKVTSGRSWGDVFFRGGEVYYAASSANGAPLGERLVKAGKLSSDDLRAVLDEQKRLEQPRLVGAMLKERGLVSDEALERFVVEQIEDSVFNLFTWEEGEFGFQAGEEPPVSDVVVSLDAEGVIMEGCRRVDEWRMVMDTIGSLEKVPSLGAPTTAREITIRSEEWDVLCFIDGRRDVNTIIADSGFDRFRTVKTIYQLISAGLVLTRDPTLELLGQRVAIALRGPIDIYNLTFLTTACTSDISSHLRIETIEDQDVEIQMSAGVREGEGGDDALLYFSEARTPLSVVRRMALETSGYIVLVNVNSEDSVLVSRRDIALLEDIGDRPYVVAAYSSMADEALEIERVRALLDLSDRVPATYCNLRDPDDARRVVNALTERLP